MVLTHQMVGASVLLLDTSDFVSRAGAGDGTKLVAVMVAGAHFLGSIVALFLTDSIGRRAQLLTGLGGLGIIGATAGVLLATEAGLASTATCLYIYVGIFQCFFSPMFYCVITEIFPVDLRATAISLAFSSLFVFTFVINLVYNVLRDATIIHGTNNEASWFFLFSLTAITSWCVLHDEKTLPETKGMSLFDAEALWR